MPPAPEACAPPGQTGSGGKQHEPNGNPDRGPGGGGHRRRALRRALLTARGAVHDIRAKSRTDFVTDVDMRVQAMLRSRLGELAPGVQFMGEEQDNAAIDPSRPCWILDPVDGTTNLIRGLNHSAVSLALAEGGRPYSAPSSTPTPASSSPRAPAAALT